jgi:CRP-like cAMP-binding protein
MHEFQEIQASLMRFTRRIDEIYTDCFTQLRHCSFFDAIPSEYLALISEHTEIRACDAGEVIAAEGEGAAGFYVILSGETRVYHNNQMVGTVGAGECLGEGVFLASENVQRSATVIAANKMVVAEIKSAGIDRLYQDDHLRGYMDKALMFALFKKLQGANRKIEQLMTQPAALNFGFAG